MSGYNLIVSDPPHPSVDFAKAVPCFRLSRAEVQMKANYGIPEIWFAGQDRSAMVPIFETLKDSGLNVVFVTGEVLQAVPQQTSATAFTLRDADLVVAVDEREITIPYDAAVIGISCKPSRGPTAGTRSSATTALGRLSHTGLTPETLVGRADRRPSDVRAGADADMEYVAFLDLYVPDNGGVRRIAFVEGRIAFSGLGDRAGKSAHDNLVTLLEECESRFAHAQFDRRLLGMGIRRRILVGEYPPDERRKGYSFATRALSQLLESIAPSLKRVTETELCSRLAYLTHRERDAVVTG